ncbi:hypothetical protein G5B30_16480 [Sphingobacterium sp. SGG-5]|uniref:hypothetical protein n=1 Tax=Sphingobacterium sp. SGG-5 TaxID=2710881 RepID=UPI0013EC314B|nr:hypothetical protein [Sphingobacterium sp. SGG-5]NGM63507.1 hypothetical protein [Sphingobacterium sp. SGG-5]
MATNGICSIKVKGVEYPLYFGMLAIEEVGNRMGNNPSSNMVKITTDIVYAGMCNWAFRKDLVYPTYESVSDIIEDLFDEEDASEQYINIDKCFRESKYGSKLINAVEDVKKKVMKDLKKPETT